MCSFSNYSFYFVVDETAGRVDVARAIQRDASIGFMASRAESSPQAAPVAVQLGYVSSANGAVAGDINVAVDARAVEEIERRGLAVLALIAIVCWR